VKISELTEPTTVSCEEQLLFENDKRLAILRENDR